MFSTFARLPGDHFGWMVKTNDSWPWQQHSAWRPSNLNFMGIPLQPRHEASFQASITPHTSMFPTNIASPRFTPSVIPSMMTGQTDQVYGLFQCLPRHCQGLLPTPNLNLKEKQSACSKGLGGRAMPSALPESTQRRFLVFDQSGNQTRLIFNSANPPPLHPTIAFAKHVLANDLCKEEHEARVAHIYPAKAVVHEKSDENQVNGEGSEMHEDTEEINALLYSDDCDDYSENDEEISTAHSPFMAMGSYKNPDLDEEIAGEVASSDGPAKRQRLLDGGYNKSTILDTASFVKLDGSRDDEDDAESSCVKGRTKGDNVGSILGNKRPRKDMVHETLKILENIVPGSKGKEPLLVLDEAINYFKSLKLKAKALGLTAINMEPSFHDSMQDLRVD